MELIKKINTEYKEKEENMNFKNFNELSFEKNILTLSVKNKKKLVGTYIFFGIYQPTTHLWIWANAIPGVNKKNIKYIKELKTKSYLFENDGDKTVLFLYQFLTNDVILIEDYKNLDIINKTLCYLSDTLIMFNPSNEYGNTQYIGLKNIKEKYF